MLYTGATNKYDEHGMLLRSSLRQNSCNWSSMSSAAPAMSQDDIDKLELAQLINDEQPTDKYQQIALELLFLLNIIVIILKRYCHRYEQNQ